MKFKVISDDNRKLKLNFDVIDVYTSRWKPGTSFDIDIVKRQPRKSNPLRKYYFSSVIRPFMDYLGYEPDELDLFHRQLKIVYFGVEKDSKGIYRSVPSVFSNESEIEVPIKKKFVDWVIRKAAMDGVYIEDPK